MEGLLCALLNSGSTRTKNGDSGAPQPPGALRERAPSIPHPPSFQKSQKSRLFFPHLFFFPFNCGDTRVNLPSQPTLSVWFQRH